MLTGNSLAQPSPLQGNSKKYCRKIRRFKPLERIFNALNRSSVDDYKLHDRNGISMMIINCIKVILNSRTLIAVNYLRKGCSGGEGVDLQEEITVTGSLAAHLLNILS